MTDLRKVYLPPWMAWFGLAVLVPMWGWITWQVFLAEGGGEDLGVVGWLVTTAVMAVVAVVMVMMGKRKLPAYLIELEDDETGEGTVEPGA